MRVRVPARVMRDLEYEFTAVHALPTIARSRRGMKTDCAVCGEKIDSEFFYVGFAPQQPNRTFHFKCLDDISQTIATFPKCQKCQLPCTEGTGQLQNGNYIHLECVAPKDSPEAKEER